MEAIYRDKQTDRIFCITPWDELFPSPHLRALATMPSNHCPILTQDNKNTEDSRYVFEIMMNHQQQDAESKWIGCTYEYCIIA